ncbi:unnamed protein product [Boreogadus saida]
MVLLPTIPEWTSEGNTACALKIRNNTNTATNGGIRVLLQEDNNLVMYTKERQAVWSSVSHNDTPSSKMRLTMTNEGHLVLDKDAQAIWSSEKSEGCKQ